MVVHLLCWFILAILGIVNGLLREKTYGRRVSELAAHQLSTLIFIVLSGLLVWGVSELWPLASPEQAWLVGVIWLAATVAFEFGFGHWVVGHAWAALLRDYNLLEGRLWLLVPAWILVMPAVFHSGT